MTISQRQKESIQNQITQRLVTSGEPLDETTIAKRLLVALGGLSPGKPTYTPPVIEAGSVSATESLTEAWGALLFDLEVARDELGSQESDLKAATVTHQVKVTALQHQISRLSSQIRAVEKTGFRDLVLSEAFVNTNNLEDEELPYRNIPATSLYVDLPHGVATCRPLARHSGKIDLTEAQVFYQVRPKEAASKAFVAVHGDPQALVSETDEPWFVEVQTTESEITLEVELRFAKPVQANIVYLAAASGLGTVELLINDSPISPVAAGRLMWHFVPQALSRMVWRFTKRLPEESGGPRRFYFGLKEAEVYLTSHEATGVLVSKPTTVKGTQIQIEAEPFTLPGTSLRYHYGLEIPGRPIQWNELSLGNPATLQALVAHDGTWTPDDTGYGEEVLPGLYQIGTLSQSPYADTLKVQFGEGMWQLERAPISASGIETALSVDDWIAAPKQALSLLPLETLHFQPEPGYLYRFLTWVWSDSPLAERWLPTGPGTPVSLGLNMKSLQRLEDGSFLVPLAAGWNRLELFLTHPAGETWLETRFYVGGEPARAIVNPSRATVVSIPDLVHNYSGMETTCCAVHGQKVLVNYNPLTLGGARYTFQYHTAEKDQIQIRLMIVANSSDPHLTPCLAGYTILSR